MRPLGARTAWVVGLLGAQIALGVASIVVTLGELDLLERVQGGGSVGVAEAQASDARVGAVAVSVTIAFVATVIAWCMWQHRAHKNLHAAGRRGLRFTPGWGVGWWFVPFANLGKPFQAVRELHKGSDPDSHDDTWDVRKTWPVLSLWWSVWIVSLMIDWVFVRTLDENFTLDAAITSDRVSIGADLASIVAAALAIIVVRSIAARQAALESGMVIPPRIDIGPPVRPPLEPDRPAG